MSNNYCSIVIVCNHSETGKTCGELFNKIPACAGCEWNIQYSVTSYPTKEELIRRLEAESFTIESQAGEKYDAVVDMDDVIRVVNELYK